MTLGFSSLSSKTAEIAKQQRTDAEFWVDLSKLAAAFNSLENVNCNFASDCSVRSDLAVADLTSVKLEGFKKYMPAVTEPEKYEQELKALRNLLKNKVLIS